MDDQATVSPTPVTDALTKNVQELASTELSFIPEPLKPYMPMVQAFLLAILIFVVGWFLSKWVRRLVRKAILRRADEALSRFLAAIAQYAVLAAALIAALGAVGIETTSLVAVFASAGLAIGLALQGNLANFASGVMILFFKPFVLQDVVTVAGQTGTIEDIGLFATTLVTPAKHKVIVPNRKITDDVIVNLTTMGIRRAEIDIGVAYGSEVEKVKEVLLAAVRSVDLAIDEPAPSVVLIGFGASSVDYKVYCFAKSADWWDMQNLVRVAVYDGLNAAGIEIPFSQIVVHKADAA